MKKLRLVWIAFLLTGLAACNEDDTDPALSNEEAAEMVATALAEDASGFTVVVAETSATTSEALEGDEGGRINTCGYSNTVSMSRTNPAGTVITYNYDYSYNYQLTCSADQPLKMDVSVSYDGEFSSPRFASNHLGDMDLSVSALDISLTNFLFNGNFEQAGSFESKIRNRNSGSSTLQFTLTDVTVNKTSRIIASGTASVMITGEVVSKGSYSFEATVTFLGNHSATIAVEGTTYLVDLVSGTITQQ